MRLHDYSASANCYKVRLALAQLGLGYERVPVDIFGGDTLTDEFARLNPARMTPVLETDEGEALPESNAILVYLAEGTQLMPEDRAGRAHVLRWLFYEQAEVQPGIAGLRFRLLTGRLEADDPNLAARQATGTAVLDVLEAHLRDQPFLAGRYSIADISLYAYVHVAGDAGFDLGGHPAVRAWIGRVEATPGHMNDLEPMPPNSRVGVSRSIYG